MPRTTVLDFANQICERARKFDTNIIGDGMQIASENAEHSCRVYCKGKHGKPITKSWTYPDGTICRNQNSDTDKTYFCVNGRCEVSAFVRSAALLMRIHGTCSNCYGLFKFPQKFSCDNASTNYFKMDSAHCLQQAVKVQRYNNTGTATNETARDFKNVDQMKPSAASLVQRYTRNGTEANARLPVYCAMRCKV